MSLSAAVIDALVATGATVEQLAAAMKADLAESEARLVEKRAKDAARQRKSRMSRDVTVTSCDSTDTPAPLVSPLPLSPDPYPQPPYNPPTPAKLVRAKSSGYGPPERVSAEAWDGFCKQRKKRMTQIAFDGIVERLAEHTNDLWPPDRLIRRAIECGHETIWPVPKDLQNARGAGNSMGGARGPSLSGHGSVVDSAQRVIARHQARAGGQLC